MRRKLSHVAPKDANDSSQVKFQPNRAEPQYNFTKRVRRNQNVKLKFELKKNKNKNYFILKK